MTPQPRYDARSDRAAALEQARAEQRSRARRAYLVVGGVGLVAVLLVAAATYALVRDRDDAAAFEALPLADLGAAASACTPAQGVSGTAAGDHLPTGEQVTYPDAPPATGPHWSEYGVAPASFSRKFYTAQDRPELEALVHNLEHGYTVLWYDDAVAGDDAQVEVVEAIADKFRGTDNPRFKFIAVPWTADDVAESGAFPDGSHVAFSHWSAQDGSAGVVQYCSEPSGAAVQEFMTDHPYTDSPEPDAP